MKIGLLVDYQLTVLLISCRSKSETVMPRFLAAASNFFLTLTGTNAATSFLSGFLWVAINKSSYRSSWKLPKIVIFVKVFFVTNTIQLLTEYNNGF